MRTYIIICVFLYTHIFSSMKAQETFRTGIFRDDIKSLEVKVEGELISTPFIELNGDNRIEITFDALHHSTGRFAYSVIHCDANWTKSSLIPIEYMKGFQREVIHNYAIAIGTTTKYVNYKLSLPNDNMQLIASGNYAVQIFDEDVPDKVVITACFSIVEPLVEIDAGVSGNTDIDFNKEHQQVEFMINTSRTKITSPQSDLKVFVYQNNNLDDIRANIQPTMFNNNRLQYRNNRALIFEAGNEFRRIEFQTHRFNEEGVEAIAYFNPYYHLTLFQEKKRHDKPPLNDQDQNGRFFIRCRGCNKHDTESDYYIVHFSLASEPMPNGKMHLFGYLFNNTLDSKSVMEYNSETGTYEKSVLLKTGLYNYQYVFLEEGATKPSVKLTEGNFFETENEYTITVYYRPFGTRNDQLIGYKTINSKQDVRRPGSLFLNRLSD